MRKWLIWAVVLMGCGRRDLNATRSVDAGEVAAIDAMPPTLKAAEPARQVFKFSFANFRGDDLDECDDFIIDAKPAPDGGTFPDPTNELQKRIPKTSVRVPKLCQEQFSDRVALAACIHEPNTSNGGDGYVAVDGGAQVYATVIASFYSFETLSNSDLQMKLCLREHGDWKAVPKTSEKWQDAKREHDMDALRKQVRRLQ